ncbi:MAG: hypothetical protein AAFO07_19670 [Bacteroidota bacterium]
MDLHLTQVPAWVSTSFALFLLTVPILLIANAVKRALDQANRVDGKMMRRNIIIFYLIYFMVTGVLSILGTYAINTFPPRIIVGAALPLFLFYFLVVQRKEWFKAVFKYVSLETLVYIHLFRFVGVFFFTLNSYGVIPDLFAKIGGTGDVLTAILVIPVIYFIRKKASFANTLVWIWNTIGLIDILSVLSTALILTREAIINNQEGVLQIGTFPFSWIPAFAPATIIFLHILVYRKLIKEKSISTNDLIKNQKT